MATSIVWHPRPQRSKPQMLTISPNKAQFSLMPTGSSVCTPTRHGLPTGRYSWRTRLQGVSQDLLQAPPKNRQQLQVSKNGYHTACTKWHLDFQYLDPDTKSFTQKEHKLPPVGLHPRWTYTSGIRLLPWISSCSTRKAVIENDRNFHDDEINMLPRLTEQSATYIDSRADKEKAILPLCPFRSPHTPIVPSKKWQGKARWASMETSLWRPITIGASRLSTQRHDQQ